MATPRSITAFLLFCVTMPVAASDTLPRQMLGASEVSRRRGLPDRQNTAKQAAAPAGRTGVAEDTIRTADGDLAITPIGHASLMFTFNAKVIHVDPWSKLTDYNKLPKADVILITHEHRDHLDPEAIKALQKDTTRILANPASARSVPGAAVMKNGETREVHGISIEAVPAYNIRHMRSPNLPYHPKGNGNGYVLTFGDKRIYVAGDTENTPEMKALRNIDCAFLPMNVPYTMTPQMAADAAKAIKPGMLYPYHYGESDPAALTALLKDTGIEVRIREMR